MSNASIKNAFERMWQHVIMAISSKAAPAGYGLGSSSRYLEADTDLNNIVECGFYAYAHSSIPANGISIANPFQYVYHLNVSRDNNGTIVQEITTCGVSPSDANYRVRRVCGFGGWSEWEYINPPMIHGQEYRTTERWNGKPVYRKLIKYTNAEALQGTAYITIPHGISNLNMVLTALGTTNQYLLPYVSASTSLNVSEWNGTNLYLYNGNSTWSANRDWYIELRYTKSE